MDEIRAMKPIISAILVGSLAVISFDAVGSLASRSLGFKYKSLIFGSWLLYATVGYFVGRGSDLWSCAFAGSIVGLVDATLGWAVSWWIGPGHPTAELSASAAVSIVLIIVLSGAAFGWIGGVVSRLL